MGLPRGLMFVIQRVEKNRISKGPVTFTVCFYNSKGNRKDLTVQVLITSCEADRSGKYSFEGRSSFDPKNPRVSGFVTIHNGRTLGRISFVPT